MIRNPPTGCSRPTAPPCSAAMAATIDRPSPVPPLPVGEPLPWPELLDGGRPLSLREAAAIILHDDAAHTAVESAGDTHPARCVPQRVVDEVVEKSSEEDRVTRHVCNRLPGHLEADVSAFGGAAPPGVQLLHEIVDGEGLTPHVQRAGVPPRQEEQAVGEHGKPGRLVRIARGWPRSAPEFASAGG